MSINLKTKQLHIYLDERSNQQIPSRCFRRSRYLGGGFLPLYVPLLALGNASVPAGYLLIAALSKNNRAIAVGRREVLFLVPESYRWEFIKQESAGVKQLAAETGYPEVFAGLLAARGVHNKEEVQRFLYPSEKNMYDPFLMKGMEAAVCRISQAMDAHEKITIYGDYDVDGITATSILYLYLSKAGAEVDYYLRTA